MHNFKPLSHTQHVLTGTRIESVNKLPNRSYLLKLLSLFVSSYALLRIDECLEYRVSTYIYIPETLKIK